MSYTEKKQSKEVNPTSIFKKVIDNTTTYTLSIYSDENHTNSVVEVHLDANGKQKSAPAQNATKAETTFSFTVLIMRAIYIWQQDKDW